MPRTQTEAGRAETAMRAFALRYPEAYEEFPWGERVIKVNKKIFVFLNATADGLSIGVKLPWSAEDALGMRFVEPTGYGLGKSGWVTARFSQKQKPPVDLLCDWIDESYRAIAPKRLVGQLPDRRPLIS